MSQPQDADAIATDRVVAAGARLGEGLRLGAGSFLFLRHGRTEANRRGIIQGQQDVPLDEAGRAQAREAAGLLQASGGAPTRIVASDLVRAAETARIIAAQLGMAVGGLDPGLRERGFGPVEGTAARQLAWAGDPEGAEPIVDFVARCRAALQRHLAEEGVLLVAHGGVLRATAALLRVPLGEALRGNAVPLRFSGGGSSWGLAPVAP